MGCIGSNNNIIISKSIHHNVCDNYLDTPCTKDINLTLPTTANNDIEVDFAVGDTTYNINCDYLSLIPVSNTYYQVVFSYDKMLQTWFSSVVSNNYSTTAVEAIADEED